VSTISAQYALLHDEMTAEGSPFEIVPLEVEGRSARTWKQAPTSPGKCSIPG
jgi:hypothetical protein